MPNKYKAFISYSWADKPAAEWLHRALETYVTPRGLVGKDTPLGPVPARLHPIFRDRTEEAAGHGIGAAVEAAMADSDFLIVLCSPRAARSQWVNREVAWFKRNRDATRILCVIADGEPGATFLPGREAEECFPASVLYTIGEGLAPTTLREDAPLAADMRPEGDGKRGAKLKVAAAMLGVGLDDLVRRDARRQTLRRRIVTTLAVSVAAVTSGLAVIANDARREAEFQRDEAQGLVEFMLTDLRSRLDAVGRLDVLEAVGDRLSESYARQDLTKLDADALGRQARVQLLLGEIDNQRGDLDAALARYTEAAATTEEQLRRNPGSAQQIFDHAQSVFWVGYIAWQRRDTAAAEKAFLEYQSLAQKLVAIDPSNDDWQSEMEYAFSNLGTLALQRGDGQGAKDYFRQSRDVSQALMEKNPGDADRMLAAGQSLAWLADAHYHKVELAEAGAARAAERRLYMRGLEQFPDHARIRLRLVVTDLTTARILLASGDPASAAKQAEAAIRLAEEMKTLEPEDTERSALLARAQIVLGDSRLGLGQLDPAREAFKFAEAEGTRLLEIDSTVTEWQVTLVAEAKLSIAQIDIAHGRSEPAKSVYGALEEDLARISESSAGDPNVVRRHCAAIAGSARLGGLATAEWTRIADALDKDTERHGPEALTLLVEAYANLKRDHDARVLAARLYSAGYRHHAFTYLLDEFPHIAPAPN